MHYPPGAACCSGLRHDEPPAPDKSHDGKFFLGNQHLLRLLPSGFAKVEWLTNLSKREEITMRPIFAAVVATVGLLAFGVSPIEAAVFSVGAPDGSIGNTVCMDVSGNSIKSGTPVIAQECHAGPNQQYQWAGPKGRTIFTVGGQNCLDVFNQETADGTLVQSVTCRTETDTVRLLAQEFAYENGQIIFLKPDQQGHRKCLDAINGIGEQLVINTCNGSDSQQWQIK